MINKVKNLIKRGLITLTRKDEFGQCLSSLVTGKYQALYPLGLYGIPKQSEKPLVIIFNVNADEANRVGIENNPKTYPAGLEGGDFILYNPTSKVMFKTTAAGKIAMGDSTTEVMEQISQTLSEISDDANAAAVHTHISAVPGSPSAPPNNAAAFLAVAGKIDAIKILIDDLKATIT